MKTKVEPLIYALLVALGIVLTSNAESAAQPLKLWLSVGGIFFAVAGFILIVVFAGRLILGKKG
jgi:hypothetical protein